MRLLALLAPAAFAQLILPEQLEELKALAAAEPVSAAWGVPGWLQPAAPPAKVVKKQTGFCGGPDAVTYSGYLPAGPDASYFFWLQRTLAAAASRPLLLWLSGGPGCSSSMAALMENGPCRVAGQRPDGTWELSTHEHAWTEVADVVWVDQPAMVGYSQGGGWSQGVSKTEADVGEHMFNFMKAFFLEFPDLKTTPFYVFGESYGGHFVPAVASRLLREIQKGTDMRLDGVAIGNGLVDPIASFETNPEMAYTGGGAEGSLGHGVVNRSTYHTMLAGVPKCKAGAQQCQQSRQVWDCLPALMHCMGPTMMPVIKAGYNPYDLRQHCPEELRPLCFNLTDTSNFMNDASIQKALGVHHDWKACNIEAGLPFHVSGDWMQSTSPMVAEILDGGVPFLAYYGDTDFMCQWLGGKRWATELSWTKSSGWKAAEDRLWRVDGEAAGRQRSFGGFTFLQIYNAGHLVPRDQPKVSLAMVQEFISSGSGWKRPPSERLAEPAAFHRWTGALGAATATAALVAAAFGASRCRRRASAEAEAYLLLK